MNACLPICNPYIIKTEVATMLNPISNKIENVWESWSIRAVMLFSLCLQIFLTICSPLRKRMNSIYIQIFIWLAYLMADSAAIFCVGHISSNQISSNKIKINTQNHLLALWAPFLMVHLGGPETITAFSLEDNQLWRRHMLGFITQFLFCAYVFLLTVPGNKLWIPIVLIFVAGIIKYGERIYAMYLASTNVIGWMIFEDVSDQGIDLAWQAILGFENEMDGQENLIDEPLISLRVFEVVMNLYYDKFFTKFSLSHGYLSRFVTISCLLTALGLFLFEEKQYKQGFDPFDIKVTYTLMCGAVALDVIALFMQCFSYRVVFFFPSLVDFSFVKSIIQLKKTRWSKCKKNPYTKFTQLSTLLPFRKWVESISGFNIISYSRYMMRKQSSPFHYFNRFSGGSIFMRLHEVKNPFLLELWDFILTELRFIETHLPQRDSKFEFTLIFRDISISEEIKTKLIAYMRDIALDELLIVWHIATHLCYVQELDVEVDEREFSKLLSDYMMYLLVLQSDIIPNSKSIDIKRIQDEFQGELKPYFINGDGNEVVACRRFVADNAFETNSPIYSFKNVCMLAKVLGMLSEASIKWKIISKVWVRLLLLAARECSVSIHFQHLTKGGELISFIRLFYEFRQIH